MKVLCSYSWMLCKHNSSGGNSREANSFLTSCQRVGGYGVTSAWCSLSTTRSGHFQMDVPFIFVKWIYKIKSGSRWKWISRMHSCAEMEMISETLDAWAGEASQRPSAVLAIVCVPGRQCALQSWQSPQPWLHTMQQVHWRMMQWWDNKRRSPSQEANHKVHSLCNRDGEGWEQFQRFWEALQVISARSGNFWAPTP